MIRTRPLTIQDYDSLVALWGRAGLNYRRQGRDSRESLARQLEGGKVAILGAEADGRLIGSVMVSDDGRKGWINRLAVDLRYRRQGLGARLIAAAEEELKGRGMTVMAALIEVENAPSIDLFAKVGYLFDEGILYFSKGESGEA